MRRNFLFALAAILLAMPTFTTIAKNTLPKGDDELETLKNSTMVVVLLEENQKLIDKLTKQHKALLITTYRNAIKTYNDNVQATAGKYLSISAGIEYKTMSEIISLPASTRESYSYLVCDRSATFPNGTPVNFAFDFYADNQEELQGMADDYKESMNFDAADPKYHGEDDYRRIEIYAKNKKKASVLIFTQSLDMIIPTKGSLALCFMGIQRQFNDAISPEVKETREQAKQKVRLDVAKARRKNLLICKDNLDRNIIDVKIKKNFLYPFTIVTRDQFDQAILNKDTSSCVFVVYPADKTQGSFRPTVNYQHLIVDAETADVLVTVVPEVNAAGMAPSYQKINDRQFKDVVKTEDEMTK